MRIPINALKEFLRKFGLTHIVVFACDENNIQG
jgi:hypothetical protein